MRDPSCQVCPCLGAARAGAHVTHPQIEAVEPLVGNVDRPAAFPGAIRRFPQLRLLEGGTLGEIGLRRGHLLGELALRRADLFLYKALRRAGGAEHGDTAAEDQESQSSRHESPLLPTFPDLSWLELSARGLTAGPLVSRRPRCESTRHGTASRTNPPCRTLARCR